MSYPFFKPSHKPCYSFMSLNNAWFLRRTRFSLKKKCVGVREKIEVSCFGRDDILHQNTSSHQQQTQRGEKRVRECSWELKGRRFSYCVVQQFLSLTLLFSLFLESVFRRTAKTGSQLKKQQNMQQATSYSTNKNERGFNTRRRRF